MIKIPRPIGENQFLVINPLAPVEAVSHLLWEIIGKLRYVVVCLEAGEYAVFTPEEFVMGWAAYRLRGAPRPIHPLIKDVPQFTAPKVAPIAQSHAGIVRAVEVDLSAGEQRIVILAGREVVGLIVERFRDRVADIQILYQPVLLHEVSEIGDDYKSDYQPESGSPPGFDPVRRESDQMAIAQYLRGLWVERGQIKHEGRIYRRLADEEMFRHLVALTKHDLVAIFLAVRDLGLAELVEADDGTLRLALLNLSRTESHYGLEDTTHRHLTTALTNYSFTTDWLIDDLEASQMITATTTNTLLERHGTRKLIELTRKATVEPAERRWINVQIEGVRATQSLQVERVYMLSFDVDVMIRETSIHSEEFVYEHEPGETEVELDIHLSSQDFRIYNDRQKLHVSRTGKSENKARFDIKPLKRGIGTLKALILKDNNLIQELTLTLEVGRRRRGKIKIEAKGRPPEAAAIIKPRDVHLNISYDQRGFTLKYVSGITAEATIPLTDVAVDSLAQSVRDVWEKIIETKSARKPIYQTGVHIPPKVGKSSLKKLAEAGFLLFKKIFYENADKQTQAMGDLLRQMARKEKLQIQIASERFFLPWGVLYMSDDLDHIEPEMFLGLKHVIEHIPSQKNFSYFSLNIDGTPKFTISLNLDEGIDGEAEARGITKKVVGEQVEFWSRLKASGSVDLIVRGSSDELIEELRNHSMSERLIYFYCHASARMGNSKPSVTLGDGKRLSTDELSKAEGKITSLTSAPLVFINACDSAELSPFFYDDFLNFFVSRGARGAIGTECKIPALFGTEWAKRFFTHFLPGKSLGELFLNLRREFYFEHNNLLGLAYALYCDGDTQILPSLSVEMGEASSVPARQNHADL
jgi:hypothetical protein